MTHNTHTKPCVACLITALEHSAAAFATIAKTARESHVEDFARENFHTARAAINKATDEAEQGTVLEEIEPR